MAERRGPARAGKLRFIPAHKLERGHFQPRQIIDGPALTKLAESIRAEGIIQPILVRKARGGKYAIVAGERRWLAAKLAGLASVPCVVANVSDRASLALGLIENLHREDLNPIDQALAMRQLVEVFSLTHQDVADAIGKSRATVTNLLRLLELPESVRSMVADGAIDMGHARALLGLPREARAVVAERAARHGLSVRTVERLARERPAPAPEGMRSNALLQQAVRSSLHGCVDVHPLNKEGRWRLRVDFADIDELHRALRAVDELLTDIERTGTAPAVVTIPR